MWVTPSSIDGFRCRDFRCRENGPLSDDKTVAKMGHPVFVEWLDVGHPVQHRWV